MTETGKDGQSVIETALIDVKVVAKLLDCSTRHVTRLEEGGLMPAPIRLGRLCKWSRRVIEEWIAGGCKAVRQTSS
jgi:predicted DNA-binding transcriptional regulator AlpA